MPLQTRTERQLSQHAPVIRPNYSTRKRPTGGNSTGKYIDGPSRCTSHRRLLSSLSKTNNKDVPHCRLLTEGGRPNNGLACAAMLEHVVWYRAAWLLRPRHDLRAGAATREFGSGRASSRWLTVNTVRGTGRAATPGLHNKATPTAQTMRNQDSHKQRQKTHPTSCAMSSQQRAKTPAPHSSLLGHAHFSAGFTTEARTSTASELPATDTAPPGGAAMASLSSSPVPIIARSSSTSTGTGGEVGCMSRHGSEGANHDKRRLRSSS